MPGIPAEVAPQPEAPSRPEKVRSMRPLIVGPDCPEPPFPILLSGPVQKGFGRGSKDLGCPTGSQFISLCWHFFDIMNVANLPDASITPITSVAKTGVYYGYAQVLPPKDGKSLLCEDDMRVLPMVMSLGWNPFYKNEKLTAVRVLIYHLSMCLYMCRKYTSCTNSQLISTDTR